MSDEITPIDLREVAEECTHDPVIRNHLRGAADIIEALRAANARLQAWHDAVMDSNVKAVLKVSSGLAFISTLCPDNGSTLNEGEYMLQIRPQPLAKE